MKGGPASTVPGEVLRARGLVFDHPGPLRAVDGVDLELAPGELLVVLGPNGSGKSTLLQLLGGLLEPAAGEVRLGERPLVSLTPRERARRIAVVPQFLPLLQDVRVEQFVWGGRYAHRSVWGGDDAADAAAVAAALQESDAADLGERLLTELSGGQRQRVLVARALAQEADLLLFDEPTASLDPDHQVMVFELIRDLVARGRSAVVVTHELPLASRYGSRLLLLDGGRVVAGGSADEVLAREVLEPVYGAHLHYGRVDGPVRGAGEGEGGAGHPLVVPWPRTPG